MDTECQYINGTLFRQYLQLVRHASQTVTNCTRKPYEMVRRHMLKYVFLPRLENLVEKYDLIKIELAANEIQCEVTVKIMQLLPAPIRMCETLKKQQEVCRLNKTAPVEDE
nr:uncharacterized protein LOC116652306 [Drosophila virilis]